jgi:ATP-dependent Clp protease ATP-binding subunit ClpC
MFERFTDRARRVITYSNQEAQRLNHDHVGTEHLLLGLVRESTGTAAIVLHEFNVNLGAVRQQIEQRAHGPSEIKCVGELRRTERYNRVIGSAKEEAESLGKNYVGTEHLLLGLLRESEGTAARVLAGLNLRLEEVRLRVLELLGRSPQTRDLLLDKAMRDLKLHLADEEIDTTHVRRVAEALIAGGWRPQH